MESRPAFFIYFWQQNKVENIFSPPDLCCTASGYFPSGLLVWFVSFSQVSTLNWHHLSLQRSHIIPVIMSSFLMWFFQKEQFSAKTDVLLDLLHVWERPKAKELCGTNTWLSDFFPGCCVSALSGANKSKRMDFWEVHWQVRDICYCWKTGMKWV